MKGWRVFWCPWVLLSHVYPRVEGQVSLWSLFFVQRVKSSSGWGLVLSRKRRSRGRGVAGTEARGRRRREVTGSGPTPSRAPSSSECPPTFSVKTRPGHPCPQTISPKVLTPEASDFAPYRRDPGVPRPPLGPSGPARLGSPLLGEAGDGDRDPSRSRTPRGLRVRE